MTVKVIGRIIRINVTLLLCWCYALRCARKDKGLTPPSPSTHEKETNKDSINQSIKTSWHLRTKNGRVRRSVIYQVISWRHIVRHGSHTSKSLLSADTIQWVIMMQGRTLKRKVQLRIAEHQTDKQNVKRRQALKTAGLRVLRHVSFTNFRQTNTLYFTRLIGDFFKCILYVQIPIYVIID